MEKVTKYWLIGILFLALLLRLPGLWYGLPMWLIEDEPAFVTSALKMIELKNPIPAMNYDEFKGLLYYQPLLPLFYILPFGALLAGKLALFSGNFQEFIFYLKADLSDFFILARIIALAFSTATIWLTYTIGKNIFNNERVGLFSALFLSLSLLHINFSPVGKEWMPTMAMILAALYMLSKNNWAARKRYLTAGLLAGLAFGFSNAGGFAMPLILFWYLFMEKHSILSALKEKYLYQVLLIFLAIAAATTAIAPFDFFIAGGERTISEAKSLAGWVGSFYVYLWPIATSEPILSLFALAGLTLAFKKRKEYFYFISVFVLSYVSVFYLIFYHQHRYLLPIFPLLAISAGYGLSETINYLLAKSKAGAYAMAVIAIIGLLIPAIKFVQITYNNDARIIAKNWIEENLPENAKIITYAELTRLNSKKEAIEEQESIDPSSLRQIDYAEKHFGANPKAKKSFHALNLYSIGNKEFFMDLENYIKENDYQYLLISLEKGQNLDYLEYFGGIRAGSDLVTSFGDEENKPNHLSIGEMGSLKNLLRIKNVGPTIGVYRLRE